MKTAKTNINKPSSDLSNIKVAVVSTNWNEEIIKPMLKDCLSTLDEYNLEKKSYVVPGAYELPYMAQVLCKKYDAVILLGCIIKGETPNFNLISQSITNGLIKLSILYKKPVGNAVLTCFNKEQAKQRDHKGKEAVEAVLDVISQK